MSENRHTIRCAVYVFLIKDKKLFLLRRKNTGWRDGEYSLPAGHLDANESILEGAIREAKEESGVRIEKKDLSLVHTMHRQDRDKKYAYIDLFFIAKTWEGEPFLAEEEKSDDAGWYNISNLPYNMVKNQKRGFENYKKGINFSEMIDQL